MNILRISLLSAAIVGFFGVEAQNTQRLTAAKNNDYGLVYSLPRTVLDVTLVAEMTVKKPGEFYRYAKKYLNVDNPITEESRSAKVTAAVIQTHGVANPDERYMVTLKGNNSPYIELTEGNIPLSFNIEPLKGEGEAGLPVSKAADPTPLETAAAKQVITEEMLQSHSTAKRAELAAAQIFALRQSRTDLVTGQSEQMPPDGKAMELVMATIDAQEAALTAMFLGTEAVSTEVITIEYLPEESDADCVIARLSPTAGFVPADDLSGAPVYLDFEIVSRGELPVNDKGEEIGFPKGGVAYCIPGTATAEVKFDGIVLAEKTVDVAQLGVVYGMSPSFFTDKKAPGYIRLDPATGAVVESGVVKQEK